MKPEGRPSAPNASAASLTYIDGADVIGKAPAAAVRQGNANAMCALSRSCERTGGGCFPEAPAKGAVAMWRRCVVLVGCFTLVSLVWPSTLEAQKKETAADMRAMTPIFIGWVDLPLEDWALLGYETKEDWVQAITRLNSIFHRTLQSTGFKGRIVTIAKDRTDGPPAGRGLAITFSEVQILREPWPSISVALQFRDLQGNEQVAHLPAAEYYRWALPGFERGLAACLRALGEKVVVEATAAPRRKRQSLVGASLVGGRLAEQKKSADRALDGRLASHEIRPQREVRRLGNMVPIGACVLRPC